MARNSYHFRTGAGTTYAEAPPATYVVPADAYPTTRNGLTFGWRSGTPAAQDRAGSGDARISGRHASSSAVSFRVNTGAAGRVRVWLALGALNSGLSTGAIIHDGDGVDGAPGTALATIPSTAIPAASVMDAAGTVRSIADWIAADGGTFIEVTTTAPFLYVSRLAGSTFYIACVETEVQADPLVAASSTDEAGMAALAAIYGKEPAGKKIGRLAAGNGQQNFAITPGHPSETYFTVRTIDNAPWIVTTANRLPDSYSDGISVRQTSLGASRDTVFNPVVLPAGPRPVDGSILGQLTTETWLLRQRLRAVAVGERRPAYAGQTFASSQVAASLADLVAKIGALAPDGTSWYRIQLASTGAWNTVHNINVTKNFGSGGLLIVPESGEGPMVNGALLGTFHVRGIEWRNLRLAPPAPALGQLYLFNFGANASSNGAYLAMRFENCRIGELFDGSTVADTANWTSFASILFYEQIVFNDCTVDGCDNFLIATGRLLSFTGKTQIKNIRRDYVGGGYAFRLTTPRGVFADDFAYIHFDAPAIKNNPDIYAGLSTAATPHGDLFQHRRSEAGYAWSVGKNGSSTVSWAVGDRAVANDNGVYRIYAVRSVASGLSDGPPPSGTAGDGIVSGGVTWGYVMDNPLAGTAVFVLMEGISCAVWGESVNAPQSATPNIQFTINSNSGAGAPTTVVAINCISSSGNARGVDAGPDGTAHVEFCSFVGPRSAPVVGGASVGMDQPVIYAGLRVRANRNVVGSVGGKANVTGPGSVFEQGSAAVQWKGVPLVGVDQRPDQLLSGPFTRNAASNATGGDYQFPALDDANATAPDDFTSSLSRILHPIGTIVVGGRLAEKHTISVGGQAFALRVAA